MKRYSEIETPKKNSCWIVETPIGDLRLKFVGVEYSAEHALEYRWASDNGSELVLGFATPREPATEIEHWRIAVHGIDGKFIGWVSNDDPDGLELIKDKSQAVDYLSRAICIEHMNEIAENNPYQYVATQIK